MPPWNDGPLQYCPSKLLSSDDVFCDPKIIHFWMVSLGLALLFWGLLTVVNLLPLFHSGQHEQAVAGEVLRRLLIQMGLLVLTACSFYLLEVVNQGEFYLIDALTPLKSATGVCVDCLWNPGGPIDGMITSVHDLIQNQGTDDIFQTLSGGQWTFAPTDSPTAGLFGQSWGQLIGGLATFAATFTRLGPAVRYVVLVLAVGSAPFALMAAGHRATRTLFNLWLHLWGELVVLAFLSALVVAGWHAISDQVSYQLDSLTSAYVGLAALGILGGMNLAYIMRIMGSFLQTTSGFYQANFQRESGTIWGAIKLGAAVVGTAVGVGAAVGGGAAALGGEAAAGAAGNPTAGSGGPAGETGGFTPTLGTPGSAASGDAWQEWSPTTGNTTGGSGLTANTTSSGPAPGRQGGATRQAQRALPATPTGRLRGIATVLAHSGLPVVSDASRPLSAGLSYAHQTEQEGIRLQQMHNQEERSLQTLAENARYHQAMEEQGQQRIALQGEGNEIQRQRIEAQETGNVIQRQRNDILVTGNINRKAGNDIQRQRNATTRVGNRIRRQGNVIQSLRINLQRQRDVSQELYNTTMAGAFVERTSAIRDSTTATRERTEAIKRSTAATNTRTAAMLDRTEVDRQFLALKQQQQGNPSQQRKGRQPPTR